MQVRETVLRGLEAARKEKRIGSAQEAAVELAVPTEDIDFLAAHREELETICIVSRLTVRRAPTTDSDAGMVVRVERAPGVKCPRCWNFREDVGSAAAHPSLCGRCAGALAGC